MGLAGAYFKKLTLNAEKSCFTKIPPQNKIEKKTGRLTAKGKPVQIRGRHLARKTMTARSQQVPVTGPAAAPVAAPAAGGQRRQAGAALQSPGALRAGAGTRRHQRGGWGGGADGYRTR
jgi:hypothetical protein